jgi:serine protease Do
MLNKIKHIRGSLLMLLVIMAVSAVLGIEFSPRWHRAVAQPSMSESTLQKPARTDVSDARSMADQFSTLFESAAQKVSPSVVPIFAEQVVTASNPFAGHGELFDQLFGEDLFRRFFDRPDQGSQSKRTVRSLGSGVIVSEDGYILTNNHVVSGAEKLTVITDAGKKFTAKVIGTDPQSDVAVIKIDGEHLPKAKLGGSDNVRIGQWVIAVGNPFQLLHSVTAGIISAKGRSSIGLADYEDFIQTDAAINPGNSGGALADLDGNVIGINTAISSPSGASAGVGFAIPIAMAQKVMNSLIDNGKVSRGYLALFPQDIDENMAKAMHLKDTEGALVGDIVEGGPADEAGVKRGDVITEFNGKKIKDSTDLRNRVAETAPNSSIKMTLLRNGNKEHVKVKLAERPVSQTEVSAGQRSAEPGKYEKMGLEIQDLTPSLAKQLGYENSSGVLVTTVVPGTYAEEAGLRRGDLIREVDHKKITSVGEFDKALSKTEGDNTALLLIQRGENTFFAAIQVS